MPRAGVRSLRRLSQRLRILSRETSDRKRRCNGNRNANSFQNKNIARASWFGRHIFSRNFRRCSLGGGISDATGRFDLAEV
jgi:hypothetical protein